MRDILRQNNADLLREITLLKRRLEEAAGGIPPELQQFQDWIISFCDKLQATALQNLQNLNLGIDSILPNILSDTQVLTRGVRLFNQRLVGPVLRARESDRLCLKVLRWIHSTHSLTQTIPMALSDGDFASWPQLNWPTIYFMPPSAQHRLLYLPLFFHEFGHLLYACHEPEMDELVKALQKVIAQFLEPSAQRDDRHAQSEAKRRSVIVETWYEWAHELFCDAVGFQMAGPAFGYSFSMYFRVLMRDQYHLPPEELEHREYPVTWLRTRLLTDRARRMGFEAEAKVLEDTWRKIAATMGVVEDYYGFYTDEFLPSIQQTIDDMIVEVAPRAFENREVSSVPIQLQCVSTRSSLVQLLNQAWRKFLDDEEGYAGWEKEAIEGLLNTQL
ncbi:MAG: hypothetical protein ACREX3_09170 [Gammaproteobacteria bacterium]